MEKKFVISEFDVTKIGTEGHRASIKCRPVGYWTNVIDLTVRRGFTDNRWIVELSHSSGGRDTQVVESDIEAESNFARAMLEMCEIGHMLEEHFDLFESNYQQWQDEIKAEEDRIRAERQAKIDADPAIGIEQAKQLVDVMVNHARKNNKDQLIQVIDRGTDNIANVMIFAKNRVNVGFRLFSSKASKSKVVDFIANGSVRTMDLEVVGGPMTLPRGNRAIAA